MEHQEDVMSVRIIIISIQKINQEKHVDNVMKNVSTENAMESTVNVLNVIMDGIQIQSMRKNVLNVTQFQNNVQVVHQQKKNV